jgi:predicted RND superfamily exporter protein
MVVLLSVAASLGLMVALEIPASVTVQILPVFLLTVGICGAVHILSIVYQQLAAGTPKPDAIAYAIGHSGLAVVMTSATTAAGMVSFVSAKMAPIAQLGMIAPIGVALALVYTLALLPALLAVMPLRPPARTGEGAEVGRLTRALVAIGDLSTRHPGKVIVASSVFVAFFGYHASHAHFSHLALNWFAPDDPVRVAAEVIEQGLGGSMSLEVVLDTGAPNGVQDPDFLARLEAGMRWAEAERRDDLFVGKAISIVDVVQETHQALNENRPEMRVLPRDRELIAQELLLFENAGSEDLEELVDGRYQTARLSLRAPFVDAMHYGPFMEEIGAGLHARLGDGVHVELTGFMPVLAEVVSVMIVSMARSYVIALLIITPLMMLLLRDFWLGVLSMIPNLVPVIFTLGLMGWQGYPIDAATMMLGAMVIGIAVDDTIHFMHKFRIYYARSHDPREAVRRTLTTTGAALLFTSLVLAGGFFVMSLASMTNTHNFGLLAGWATVVAFVADVVLGPALMTLVARRGGV